LNDSTLKKFVAEIKRAIAPLLKKQQDVDHVVEQKPVMVLN